jgi:hypothetical protein
LAGKKGGDQPAGSDEKLILDFNKLVYLIDYFEMLRCFEAGFKMLFDDIACVCFKLLNRERY